MFARLHFLVLFMVMGGGWVAAQVAPSLTDKDPQVRRAAVKALGQMKDAVVAAPLLTRALDDQDPGVRLEAARALAAFDDPKALPVLLRALKDADPDVRAGAAEGLGTLHDPGTVPALVKASEDADRRVRLAVLGALLEIRSPLAVPALRVPRQTERDDIVKRKDAAHIAAAEHAVVGQAYQVAGIGRGNFADTHLGQSGRVVIDRVHIRGERGEGVAHAERAGRRPEILKIRVREF